MKLIVAGSTGFVATELIRQALSNPAFTSVVALGRRPAPEPKNLDSGSDPSKLKSIVLEDFDNEYPDSVKSQLAGADACIWTIAVLPSNSGKMPREQVVKISRDYAVKCLETLSQLPRGGDGRTPLRYFYISGHLSQPDQTKKPWVMGDYRLIRGDAETRILETAKRTNGVVQAGVAKPGLIGGPDKPLYWPRRFLTSLLGLPTIQVGEFAAALLHQAANGIEQETQFNEDLLRIGRRVLEEQR